MWTVFMRLGPTLWPLLKDLIFNWGPRGRSTRSKPAVVLGMSLIVVTLLGIFVAKINLSLYRDKRILLIQVDHAKNEAAAAHTELAMAMENFHARNGEMRETYDRLANMELLLKEKEQEKAALTDSLNICLASRPVVKTPVRKTHQPKKKRILSQRLDALRQNE